MHIFDTCMQQVWKESIGLYDTKASTVKNECRWAEADSKGGGGGGHYWLIFFSKSRFFPCKRHIFRCANLRWIRTELINCLPPLPFSKFLDPPLLPRCVIMSRHSSKFNTTVALCSKNATEAVASLREQSSSVLWRSRNEVPRRWAVAPTRLAFCRNTSARSFFPEHTTAEKPRLYSSRLQRQHRKWITVSKSVRVKPKFHLARHVTSPHDTLLIPCILAYGKVVTRRLVLVGQHGATRSSRQARHVLRGVVTAWTGMDMSSVHLTFSRSCFWDWCKSSTKD